ncbi:MAG TPA: hypothetical protein VE196_03015, partial [Pseudonocardiaceae bacterium]|nr:hypothetical protein [Pseudonocardiaceae bacterium]
MCSAITCTRARPGTRRRAGELSGWWVEWGDYTPAIRRWEALLGRAAPRPSEPTRCGRLGVSARFAEWVMGLPAGWVTDIPIPRRAQIRALGNGVVPAHAAHALRLLLADLHHAHDDGAHPPVWHAGVHETDHQPGRDTRPDSE